MMETRTHTFNGASCRIGKCDALPEGMRQRTRELSSLQTEPSRREEGDATALVHKVCEAADLYGITLVLFAEPFGTKPMDAERLKAWYSKTFGFMEISGTPGLMARMPGATPKFLRLNLVAEALQKAKEEVRAA